MTAATIKDFLKGDQCDVVLKGFPSQVKGIAIRYDITMNRYEVTPKYDIPEVVIPASV